MLTQTFDVARLETGELDARDDTADLVQLAVGEDVPVDEAAPHEARPGTRQRRAGDAVVQDAATGSHQPPQRGEVLVEPRCADVLEHPDRADGVERAVAHVAVVLHPDLDAILEPGLPNRAPRPVGLTLRERDADRADAVVLRRVHDHAAPATADVEQAHARLEAELAAHELVLRRLRVFQGAVRRRPHAARVRHRRSEDHAVEVVGDVVVVRDGGRVALLAVAAAVQACLFGRRRQRTQARGAGDAREVQPIARAEAHVGQVVAQREHVEDVALDVELARDVRPREPELARRSERVRRASGERTTSVLAESSGPMRLPS